MNPPVRARRALRVPAAVVAWTLLSAGVEAAPPIQASVQAVATASDNASEGVEPRQSDLVVLIQPRLRMVRSGPDLRASADLQADMVASANKTSPKRTLPYARVDLGATLVDRLFFVDSLLETRQIELDPFAARVERGRSENRQTATSYRLSPHLDYDINPRLSVRARHDAAWNRYAGGSTSDSRAAESSATFEARPQPIGLSLQWLRQRSRYADLPDDDLTLSRLTAGASIALGGEFVVGVAAGAERSESSVAEQTDNFAGLRLFWSPSPRTEIVGGFDRRFFGTGVNVRAKHRTPFTSIAVRLHREPTSLLGAVGLGGVGGSGSGLSSFLDAILTTRHPDADERGELVEELVRTRGLNTALPGAVASTAQYVQLNTGGEATWVFLGRRNTFSLSAYRLTLRQLTRSDGTPVVAGAATADNRQDGGSIVYNHLLATDMSFEASARWSRVEGLALRAGDVSRESILRLSGIRNLSPRTDLSVGLQRRKVDTNVTGLASFVETSGFVGMLHRF